MSRKKILLVDDDRLLSPMLKEYLEAKEFECHLVHDGYSGLDAFKKNQFDLCILDIRMPMKSGMELAREINLLNPDVPFLFLTGQVEKEDRIKGLEAGADDYITKPYSMQELYLRVKAILRRLEYNANARMITKSFAIGKYRFEADSREVSLDGNTVKLSEIESRLLSMFCEAADGIVSRDHALKRIWDDENSFRERSMNVYVSKLRQYLKDDPNIEIMNIHGFGYKLIVK